MIARKLITVSDVCTQTSLGKTKVYELMNEGSLEVLKIGRKTLVTVESVERLIEVSRVHRPPDLST